MNQALPVLLYSNYSEHSKRLINTIQQAPIDFSSLTSLNPLCIDNEEIRNRISKSKIDISIVPCIIIAYPDGGVEKYEGSRAFAWVEDIIKTNAPPPPPPHVPTPPQPPRRPQEPQETELEKTINEERRVAMNEDKPIPVESEDIKGTSIDDLMDEEYEEPDYRPPVSVRSDQGNYENLELPKHNEPKADTNTPRGIKSNKVNVMSAAEEMAKSRDMFDSELPRPTGMQ